MSTEEEPFADVVELCALLECTGFAVKSLDVSDSNLSQEGGIGGTTTKTIVINCQASGMHVVMESGTKYCSCPPSDPHGSGFWQVSGVAGGKMLDKEFGSSLLRGLPKEYRDRLSKQLYDMIRYIRVINDIEAGSKSINKSSSMVDLGNKSASAVEIHNSGSMVELNKETNKSASVIEIGTPEERRQHLKVDTPTRYRSLDTLTKLGEPESNPPIDADPILKRSLQHRQSTYTICSTPGSVRRRNKTSSPINAPTINLLDSLIEAEKVAEDLRNKLNIVIKEFVESEKIDSSISSMLDVSKISILKVADAKAQFASSPNLSGLGLAQEDNAKSRLKRFESSSTSNLAKPEGFKSKLRRISPINVFRKKDISVAKDKSDVKSKLTSTSKSKIVTPIRSGTSKLNVEASPNLNSSAKKKFSHIKSTIPRPSPVSVTAKK